MAKKSKSLERYKQEKPEQLLLFELVDPEQKPYSNTIELYDAIPKYLWGNQKREAKELLLLERTFKHRDVDYEVTIQPAILKGKDGREKVCFPSQREELIEDALRKLACEGKGLFLDDNAGVVFTLYELQQELKSIGHGYNLSQIKEAIIICGKSNIELKTKNGEMIIFANFFEAVGLQSKEDWKGHGKKTKAYVRFNSLVTQCIKQRTFRLLNYDKSMSYKYVLSRWMHKRLSHNYRQASPQDPYTILLSTVIRDSGVKRYSPFRNNIREVKKALNEMVEKETLSGYDVVQIKKGRKIIDAKLCFIPHNSFVKEVKWSNKRQSDMRKEEEEQERRENFRKIRESVGIKLPSEK